MSKILKSIGHPVRVQDRPSLCTVRQGIGLCDCCNLPKHPQVAVDDHTLYCLDCNEKEQTVWNFKQYLMSLDSRLRDVLWEWFDGNVDATDEVIGALAYELKIPKAHEQNRPHRNLQHRQNSSRAKGSPPVALSPRG